MKIKNTYLLFVTIFGLISLAMYTTYAMFTASLDIGGFVDLTASNLPTDTSVVEYERLTLNAGETKIIDLNITNSTASSLYYGVWYEMVEPTSITEDITIAKLDTSASETIGQLSTNTSNVVTLIIENNTTDSIVINIGVGYSQTSSLNLPTNRNLITATGSEGIDMSDVVIPETADFDYSGSAETYTVAATGQYKLEVWGAQGGSYSTTSTGGAGGYSYGTVTLNEGDTLYVNVGGSGTYSTTSGSFVAGGFNGGGAAGYRYGGSGGGASDIRLDINNDSSGTLYERIIVAGGGGGGWGYNSYNGGVGGGESGGQGTGYSTTYLAGAGTQTAGGSGKGYSSSYYGSTGAFGTGGAAATNSSSYNRSAGGGGGWYGGGGSGYRSSSSYYYRGGGGAGGGSGFVLTSSTASNVPSGYLITDTSYYLTDAATIAGSSSFASPTGTSETGHTGNGYARISYINTVPTLNGLTTVAISPGDSYDLLSDVTCVDNGDGCTLVKTSITDTSTLTEGTYEVTYIVKDSNDVKYKFTRTLVIAESMASKIISLSKGTTWIDGDDGLYEVSYTKEDGTTIGKDYRYIGAEPDNFVSFNNDLYRIIGVFDENTHGIEGEYLVKLIAAEVVSSNSWGMVNTSATSGTYSAYYNDWTGSQYTTPANLNILLNEYFYNKTTTSSTYGSCKDWTYYRNSNDYKTQNCSLIAGLGINDASRDYIQTVTWYLSGSDSSYTSNDYYLCERGMYTDCTSANSGAADATTSAKIGLMYASDYMYASGYIATDNTLTNSVNVAIQNWLFVANDWTITPLSTNAGSSLYIGPFGSLTSLLNYFSFSFRPTFYLEADVKIISGEGTVENPYQIG